VQTETETETATATATATATGPIVLLTQLARVVYRRSTVELVGMRIRELGALAYLRDHQLASQHTLSKALSIDANNCVLLLNDLEALHYVERQRDPSDRRRHLVELTTKGRAALERAELAQGSVEDEILGALSAEERSVLQRLLSRALEGQRSDVDDE
jgi:DNA-binding MarR family transcriptional regulator